MAAIATAGFYILCVFSFQGHFQWQREQEGYYDWLGRAFANGHLQLPVEPDPRLLALPNPWDPVRNEPYMVRDLVLYRGHYYLFHGATPACLLFAPYRLLTHRDLPESFAVWLFCWLGYLACCGTLMRLWWSTGTRPHPVWFGALLVAMGICNCAPYLLERVMVYEVALAAGFFCVSAGWYFLTRALTEERWPLASLTLSGLLLGLAIGCRPPLALAGALASGVIWWCWRGKRECWRGLLSFAIPFGACGFMLGVYNYARFHDPFEFGLRYIMASPNYFGFFASSRNVVPGLYYLLLSPPEFDAVFPFVRLVVRTCSRPARYFLEPIAGVLPLWPLVVLAPAAPFLAARGRNRPAGALVAGLFIFAAGSIGLVSVLGLVTQRFHADWLPYLVLLSCFALGMAGSLDRLPVRYAVFTACGAALLYSVIVNAAIGFQGPYDQFVQARPETYVKLARWFSPFRRYRPVFNPELTIDAAYEFPGRVQPQELPLVSAGHSGSRYLLSAQMLTTTRLRLTSASAPIFGSVQRAEVDAIPGAPNHLELTYQQADRNITVQWNGVTVLRHQLSFLVTAPAQVRAGAVDTEAYPEVSVFPGRVSAVSISVNGERQ